MPSHDRNIAYLHVKKSKLYQFQTVTLRKRENTEDIALTLTVSLFNSRPLSCLWTDWILWSLFCPMNTQR